jgi:hypothetical protein
MQRFVAELSTAIGEEDFEKSWRSDLSFNGEQLNIKCTFTGRRVMALLESDPPQRLASSSFYRTFGAAIRRVDPACNIRWV